jgi:hypothetical protein
MKRQIPAMMVLFIVVVCLLSPCFGATVLFEDKFATMDPGWGTPSSTVYVKDGKFIISPEIGRSQNVINQSAFLPDDMDATVTLAFQKMGDANTAPGLLFWVKSDDEFYVFLVAPSGYFAVQRKVAGRYMWPVNWQQSPAIKKGEGMDNVMRVVTKGTQGTLYINGQQVATFSGQPPAGGSQIGLGASSGEKAKNVVAFSDLKVVQP